MNRKEKKEILFGLVVFILVSVISFDRLYYSHQIEDIVGYKKNEVIQSNFPDNNIKPNPFSSSEDILTDIPLINFIKPVVEKVTIPTKKETKVVKPTEVIITTIKDVTIVPATTTLVKNEIEKILLPPESPTDYTDNGNGTITDNYTKLIWAKCTQGTSGKDCSSGKPIMKEWSKARNECDSLTLSGKDNWRLPTLKELQSIIDTGLNNPTININFFPNTSSSAYWTSTSPIQYLSSKFTVLFSDGTVYYKDGGNIATARCVRDNI